MSYLSKISEEKKIQKELYEKTGKRHECVGNDKSALDGVKRESSYNLSDSQRREISERLNGRS